jgi:hypothetical protein
MPPAARKRSIPIGTEGRTWLERALPSHQSRRGSGGPWLAVVGFVVIHQQRRNLAMQLVIAPAGVAHECLAQGRIAL